MPGIWEATNPITKQLPASVQLQGAEIRSLEPKWCAGVRVNVKALHLRSNQTLGNT